MMNKPMNVVVAMMLAGGAWADVVSVPIRTFAGHASDVYSVAFSPDGSQVLTGSGDNTAKLWDAATGTEIRTFSGYASYVSSVAFSPDGSQVLTGSGEATAKLWDAATGTEIRTFTGHAAPVYSVAFSPDGSQVLTGSRDDTAKLWDAATGTEIRTFTGHTDRVCSVAFSPDGSQVLTGSWDATAKLWNAATGTEIRTFTGHSQFVTSVAFSPDGSQVLTGSYDDTAKLWDAATGAEIRTFTGHTDRVCSVAFSPDGSQVLTGSWDATAKMWSSMIGVTIDQAAGQDDPTNALPIAFDVVFDEPMIGFGPEGVVVTGPVDTNMVSVSGSGANYAIWVLATTGEGVITASIPADVCQTAFGLPNTASTSTDNSVTYDTTPPPPIGVTVDQAAGQLDPTDALPITFDVLFDEAVTGLNAGDVVVTGPVEADAVFVSGSGMFYTVLINAVTGEGDITASIPADVCQTAGGASNTASISTDNSVSYGAPVEMPLTAWPVGLAMLAAGAAALRRRRRQG